MIRYLHLLVVGSLLWNQNLVAGEDGSATNESPASTTAATTQTPTLTTNGNVLPAPSTSAPNGTTDSPPTCANNITFKKENYTDNELHLRLTGDDNLISNINLTCDRNSYIKIQDNVYVFEVFKCVAPDISCKLEGQPCDIPITYNETVKPVTGDFNLTTKPEPNAISFTWNASNNNLENCMVQAVHDCTNSTKVERNGTKPVGAKSLEVRVSGLDPYTLYSCNSKLFYGNETIGNETENITTSIDKPGPVKYLKCSNVTKTSITFEWETPDKPNGPQPDFVITVTHESGDVKPSCKPSELTCTIIELRPFTKYNITVVAKHKISLEGKESHTDCKTLPGKPGQVRNVLPKVGPKNNEISIACAKPEPTNGENGNETFILYKNGKVFKRQKTCPFSLPDLGYLTTYDFKISYFNGFHEGDAYDFKHTTKYNDKALIGFLAFLIVVTSIALLLVLYKIYRLQKKSSSHQEDAMLIDFQDEEGRLLNIQPIPVENLLDTYKQKNADEGRLFLDEFQSIPRVFSKFCIKEARRACNQSKNRYIDILPYDDNRVVLSEISGEPGSDYINASYINGFKEPRKYIAAQGPKEETMNDFWRMIWEQKSTIIVMVTRCEEGNRNKCAQYWPTEEGDSAMFGDIEVTMREEKYFPDYINRKLHITHRREKSERDVTHVQFTVWPDHGVPDDPNLLLKLRRRIKSLSNFFSGPIVIHCSAGVGRTGTYISIDAMLEGVEAEGRVDVYGYVVQLRRQRCLMVQVESQYIFIHKALVEYNEFGETEINILELPLVLNDLKMKEPSAKICQLESEFKRIPTYRTWRPQSTGICLDNKEKNRDPRIIPYEYNRVQIKHDDGQAEQDNLDDDEVSSDEESECEDSTNYINASYLTGYWGTKEMIAAQGPLENTISDFWQMVYQKRVKAIVMLSGPSQQEIEETCFPYWVEKKTTHEDLEIELNEEKACSSYTQRFFEIRHSKRKDIRNVCQFHYDQWEGTTPKETKDLLEMIKAIKQVASTKSDEQTKISTILVHCSDGSQLTGTFYVLWNLLESANVEGVIDVFQSVKNIRKQRPGMVPSYEHYLFLHDILASTVPAQNGQIKTHMKQEDKLEIQNELETKSPEGTKSSPSVPSEPDESGPNPTDHESSSNGPSPAPFTEVALRIDE